MLHEYMTDWEEILAFINSGSNRTRKYKELKDRFSNWPVEKFTKAFGELISVNPVAVSIKASHIREENEYTATMAYVPPVDDCN